MTRSLGVFHIRGKVFSGLAKSTEPPSACWAEACRWIARLPPLGNFQTVGAPILGSLYRGSYEVLSLLSANEGVQQLRGNFGSPQRAME